MRKKAAFLFLAFFSFPLIVFAESFADENKDVPASGQCFTSDECRRMYESRAQDKENGKDYKAYIDRYRESFIDGAWEEKKDECKEEFGHCYAPPPVVPLSVKIPGLGNSVQGLSQYISSLYQFGFYGASIIAVFMIILAGYQRLMSMGVAEKIARSNDRIKRSLVALVILALSFTVLKAINPNLVSLSFKGPPLFRYRGLAGACLPRAGDDKIDVYGQSNTGGTVKFAIGSNGALIPDGILVKDANFPTCGVEFEPIDKEKYGPRCTGVFCPSGLECISQERCGAKIMVGRLSYADQKRFIREVSLIRSGKTDGDLDNKEEIAWIILDDIKRSFIMSGENIIVGENASSGKILAGGSYLMQGYKGNDIYKKMVDDSQVRAGSEEPRYYFRLLINDEGVFNGNDVYYVDSTCMPFPTDQTTDKKYGGEPNRILLFSKGLKSPGKSPFFTLNCTISDSIFPPD